MSAPKSQQDLIERLHGLYRRMGQDEESRLGVNDMRIVLEAASALSAPSDRDATLEEAAKHLELTASMMTCVGRVDEFGRDVLIESASGLRALKKAAPQVPVTARPGESDPVPATPAGAAPQRDKFMEMIAANAADTAAPNDCCYGGPVTKECKRSICHQTEKYVNEKLKSPINAAPQGSPGSLTPGRPTSRIDRSPAVAAPLSPPCVAQEPVAWAYEREDEEIITRQPPDRVEWLHYKRENYKITPLYAAPSAVPAQNAELVVFLQQLSQDPRLAWPEQKNCKEAADALSAQVPAARTTQLTKEKQ